MNDYSEVIKQLNSVSTFAVNAIMKQAVPTACLYAFIILVLVTVMVWVYKVPLTKERQSSKEDGEIASIIYFVTLVVLVAPLVVLLFMDMLTILFNPDYWVISKILHL